MIFIATMTALKNSMEVAVALHELPSVHTSSEKGEGSEFAMNAILHFYEPSPSVGKSGVEGVKPTAGYPAVFWSTLTFGLQEPDLERNTGGRECNFLLAVMR
jgi:hypothetical protein